MEIQLTYRSGGPVDVREAACQVGRFDCVLDGPVLTTVTTARDIEAARGQLEAVLFSADAPNQVRAWVESAQRSRALTVSGRIPGAHHDTYVYGADDGGRWSYRWQFIRRFESASPGLAGTACWIMLNPSASDIVSGGSRRTLQRVVTETRAFGHRDLTIVNLFAARAASASQLRKLRSAGVDIVGPRTESEILAAVEAADRVIVAWGSGGKLAGRGRAIAERLATMKTPVYCLGQATSGQPFHPTAERSGHATLARQEFRPHLV